MPKGEAVGLAPIKGRGFAIGLKSSSSSSSSANKVFDLAAWIGCYTGAALIGGGKMS